MLRPYKSQTIQIASKPAPRQVWLLRVLLFVLWTCFWFLPWQGLLASAAWLRVLFSYAAFLVPGILIASILHRADGTLRISGSGAFPTTEKAPHPQYGTNAVSFALDLGDALTLGLVISIALTALLGLAAKLFQLSIESVAAGLYVIGGAALLFARPAFALPKHWREPRKWHWAAIVPLALALGIVARLTLGNVLGGDDFWYNAYVTHYADAQTHFNGIFFLPIRPAPARYTIALWMMTEAILSKWSSLHALQFTSNFISPLMAVTSVLATYKLGRALQWSARASAWASALQIAGLLLILEPNFAGAIFFNRLTNDKTVAAFVLAPIFLRAAFDFLNAPTRRAALLVSLCAAGLVLTHPNAYGFACVILGVYGLTELAFHRRNYRPLLVLGGILAIFLIAPALLRFLQTSTNLIYALTPGDAELPSGKAARLDRWGSLLYGINPELVMGLPFGIALAACAAALTRLRSSPAGRYVLASGVLVALAVLPLTGWILGLFFTPFQLWRIPWMMPFGIAAVFLAFCLRDLLARRDWFAPRLPRVLFSPAFGTVAVIGLLVASVVWVNRNEPTRLEALELKSGWTTRYDTLVDVGHALDAELQDANVVLGTDIKTNDALPGLSAKARIVAYHRVNGTLTMGLMDEAEAGRRWQDWQTLTAPKTAPAERRRLLENYDVRYILARGNVPWLQSLDAAPSSLTPVKHIGTYTLYALNLPD